MDKRGDREGGKGWRPCGTGDEVPGVKHVESGLPTCPRRELCGNGGHYGCVELISSSRFGLESPLQSYPRVASPPCGHCSFKENQSKGVPDAPIPASPPLCSFPAGVSIPFLHR